jgi:tRNA modification GTPase
VLTVRTKADITPSTFPLSVSALTGEGLADVVAAAIEAISANHGQVVLEAPVLTRERQRYAVKTARDEVAAFATAWNENDLPAPVAAVHLRAAADSLAEMVGAIDVEDVLDRLFRTFCVGK